MLLNRLWADWQKYLYCYLSGTVLVTVESQCYSAETHCEQDPGNYMLKIVKTDYVHP